MTSKRILAVVSGALAVALMPTAASAAAPTGGSIDTLRAAVTTRIDLRLATLNALKIAVNGATDLTSSDRSTLSGVVSDDLTKLAALKTKVAGETTAAALKDDAKSMVQDYRVYMLVVPKVRLAIAGDKEATVITRLQGVHDQLVKVSAGLAAQGKDVTAANATIADLQAKLDAAKQAIDGVVDTLLAVQPSPDPAAMRAATAPGRTAVRGARADLKTAVADAKSARDALKKLAA